MESITIIAKTGDLLPVFKRSIEEILPQSRINYQGNRTDFVVDNQGSDRLYFDYEGTTLENIIGWSDSELAMIQQYFPTVFHVYSIHYRNVRTMKTVLVSIANSSQMLVDNDFGTMLSGSDFVQKLYAEPEWNWQNDLNQE